MNIKLMNPDNRKASVKSAAVKIATASLLNVFFWFMITSMLSIGMNVVLVLLSLILPVCFYFISGIKIYGKYSVFYTLLLMSLCILLGFGQALVVLFNQLADALNSDSGLVLVPIKTTASKEPYLTLGLSLFIFFTSSVFGQGTRRKNAVLPAVVSLVPFFALLFLGLVPNKIALCGFLVCFLLFILIATMKSESGMVRVRSQTALMATSLVAFVLIFSLVFSTFESWNFAKVARDYITKDVEKYRYEVYGAEYDGMPNGNLNNATSLNYTGNTVFLIDIENSSQMYLRSFTGGEINSGIWSSLPSTKYTGKYLGLMEYLETEDFHPYAALSRIMELDSKRAGSGTKLSKIHITNVLENSGVIYAPYEIVYSPDLGKALDSGIKASGWRGNREYDITSFTCSYEDYAEAKLENLAKKDNCKAEELYRAFVYDNYLSIPEDYKSISDMSKMSDKRYNDVVYSVRNMFENGFTYSESVGGFSGKDPLLSFSETKSGYDCHFASLATLMFRSAGIPARYVEGYYLSASEMKNYVDVESVSLEIYDTASHAWSEIYVDGVGWIPVEVTPGYFVLNEEESDNTVIHEQKFGEYDDKFYYDQEDVGKNEETQVESLDLQKLIVVALVAVLCLVLIIFVTFILLDVLRRKRIQRAESRKDTLLAYRYVEKKLKIHGEPYDFVETYGEEYKKFLDLIYKEVYGSRGLGSDERKEAGELALLLSHKKSGNSKNKNN